jgi:hypothetical protein
MTPPAIERIHPSCFERSVLQSRAARPVQPSLVYWNPGRKGARPLAPGRLRDFERAGAILRLRWNFLLGEGSMPVRAVPERGRP